MNDEQMQLWYQLAERLVYSFEIIGLSLEKIANPIMKVSTPPSPMDKKICTCTLDPESKKTCPIHGGAIDDYGYPICTCLIDGKVNCAVHGPGRGDPLDKIIKKENQNGTAQDS